MFLVHPWKDREKREQVLAWVSPAGRCAAFLESASIHGPNQPVLEERYGPFFEPLINGADFKQWCDSETVLRIWQSVGSVPDDYWAQRKSEAPEGQRGSAGVVWKLAQWSSLYRRQMGEMMLVIGTVDALSHRQAP